MTTRIYRELVIHRPPDHVVTAQHREGTYWLRLEVPSGDTTTDRVTIFLTREQLLDVEYQCAQALEDGEHERILADIAAFDRAKAERAAAAEIVSGIEAGRD